MGIDLPQIVRAATHGEVGTMQDPVAGAAQELAIDLLGRDHNEIMGDVKYHVFHRNYGKGKIYSLSSK